MVLLLKPFSSLRTGAQKIVAARPATSRAEAPAKPAKALSSRERERTPSVMMKVPVTVCVGPVIMSSLASAILTAYGVSTPVSITKS